jgi:DNA-binding HxlR family transcriptional regulator
MHFVKVNRPIVKAEHPEFKFTDLGKALGAIWMALTDAEKDHYQQVADEDKRRYQQEVSEYASPST